MLNEQLQQQIEQEGSQRSEGFETKLLASIAKTEYEIGAEKYAEKWQTAEQKADRYEKALNWVKQYALNCQNNRTIPNPLVIYSAIDKALTPKTTTNDTVNG